MLQGSLSQGAAKLLAHPLLVYAGLDFILDREGVWHFIEANDHPVALANADKLALTASNSLFSGQGMSTLARELIKLSNGNPVCLLLPDCFSIKAPHNQAQQLQFCDPVDNEGRSQLSITDINQLAEVVRKLNHPCFIVDKDGVKILNNKLLLRNNTEIGVLYRRSYNFPQRATNTPCANDLRLRSICTDKLKTTELLQCHAPRVNPIPTYSLEDKHALYDFLAKAARNNSYVVGKPRSGEGSRDIQRIDPASLLSINGENRCRSDFIYQPWIAPSTVYKQGFSYCVDIRVYLVAGKPVAGFARQAAAPTTGVAADSTLAWMTTTGPALPLCHAASEYLTPAFYLTKPQCAELFAQSEKVVSVLEQHAAQMDYQEVCSKLADFTTQLGIKDTLVPISLRPVL